MIFRTFFRGTLCGLVLACVSTPTYAQEFRSVRPIASPDAMGTTAPVTGEVQRPLPRAVVEEAVRQVIETWNQPGFRDKLAEQFYDGQRLEDSIHNIAPRDAKLRLLSVQGIQTYSQQEGRTADGRLQVVSTVSAQVRTQLEFNNSTGFQRREGTNEFLLQITQTYR